MKNIDLGNGQYIEKMTLNEAIKYTQQAIEDFQYTNTESEDTYLVVYKNGTTFYLGDGEMMGKFKKTGIKSVIINNPETFCVYGKYQVEKANEKDLDAECCFIVSPE